jgi:hypothetical protein
MSFEEFLTRYAGRHAEWVDGEVIDMSSEPLVETTEPDQKVPPPGPVTFEEFLAWCDEDTHAEWVDGEIIWLWQSPLPPVLSVLKELGVL